MYQKLLFFALLFSSYLPAQDLSLDKVTGIYGKDGVEFVCLELYDNYRFDMTISSCSKDENYQGKFRIEGENVLLTSDNSPGLKVIGYKPIIDLGKGIQFITKDPLLLERAIIAINYQKRIYRTNKKGYIPFEGKITHIQISYPEMETIEIDLEKPLIGIEIELEFQNFNLALIEDQPWRYEKKKLIYEPPQQQAVSADQLLPVVLRRVKKCWFD